MKSRRYLGGFCQGIYFLWKSKYQTIALTILSYSRLITEKNSQRIRSTMRTHLVALCARQYRLYIVWDNFKHIIEGFSLQMVKIRFLLLLLLLLLKMMIFFAMGSDFVIHLWDFLGLLMDWFHQWWLEEITSFFWMLSVTHLQLFLFWMLMNSHFFNYSVK